MSRYKVKQLRGLLRESISLTDNVVVENKQLRTKCLELDKENEILQGKLKELRLKEIRGKKSIKEKIKCIFS